MSHSTKKMGKEDVIKSRIRSFHYPAQSTLPPSMAAPYLIEEWKRIRQMGYTKALPSGVTAIDFGDHVNLRGERQESI